MGERLAVPAGTARAVTLRAGQRLRIVNIAGKQVADFVAFDAADRTHALSTLHTLVSLQRLFPTAGDQLRTNRRTPMLTITRDDTGRHDMLIAACDPWRYEYDFGVTGHRSCSDNFLEALAPWKIERHRLPFAPPMTDLLRAGVAGVRRQHAKARAHLERAATGFGAQEMHLYEHIARYCLEDPAATPPSSSPSSGRSADGLPSSSRQGSAQGCAWLLAQGVKRPAALAHLLAPGCLPQE